MKSNRTSDVKPFIAMDILARAQAMEKKGENVIHFEVGEPDFDTPEKIRDAAIDALKSGKTKYTHAMGMIELREAIAEHYYSEYGVSVSPERILVSSGTSPAMLMMMLALLNEGDEVVVSDPCYACYSNFIGIAGGRPVHVKTYPEDAFLYRPEMIKKALTDKTRGIIINSPSNPTGIVMSEKNLRDIAAFDSRYIISDEIYHGLVYEGESRSILEFTDRAFVINGFSKLYAMTGWRLGYLIFPEEFSSVIERIHQNFMISANNFVQIAGIAALRSAGEDVRRMVSIYNERRVFMIKRLREIGFKIDVEPTGAFYIFADAREFCGDSYSEALNILETAKVGVTPGIDFGEGGEGFLRFTYANSMKNIREGLDRIEKYVKRRRAEWYNLTSEKP